jgi:hypothetical protein
MKANYLIISEAAKWASDYLKREVSTSGISYLIQYGRIGRHKDETGTTVVDKQELKDYYDKVILKRQERWEKSLGKDINWSLAFDLLSEAERTKHVHRLHPYKGKFIPQLVEYFLDSHINTYKTQTYFKPGDIVLDPFMGSGTTLIQSAELGIHSIGVDISEFNCLIAKVKSREYNLFELRLNLDKALSKTIKFSNEHFDNQVDDELRIALNEFNHQNNLNPRAINSTCSSSDLEEKANEFNEKYKALLKAGDVKKASGLFKEKDMPEFIGKWFTKRMQQELQFYLTQIDETENNHAKDIMKIILSRTARSCRATTHFDLATLKEPQYIPYFCFKHQKICAPVNTIISHLGKNTIDTITRLDEFSKLRKENVEIEIIHGDSREVNIFSIIEQQNEKLYKVLKKNKISGIFSSPPYVGQIDYHEQHAYAYELFNIDRKDTLEIGRLSDGKGKKAQEEYAKGIVGVLSNLAPQLRDSADIFIVANDKCNLYPDIAKNSGLKIVTTFQRPVLNRTERDRNPYSESIFHMKKN